MTENADAVVIGMGPGGEEVPGRLAQETVLAGPEAIHLGAGFGGIANTSVRQPPGEGN